MFGGMANIGPTTGYEPNRETEAEMNRAVVDLTGGISDDGLSDVPLDAQEVAVTLPHHLQQEGCLPSAGGNPWLIHQATELFLHS